MILARADDLYSGSDDNALAALNRFQQYFNNFDSSALKDWAVSQDMYDQLLTTLQEKQVTCLTAFELNFSTRSIVEEFLAAKTAAGTYRLDSVTQVNVSKLDGCGGITYKKVDATGFFRSGQGPYVELPFSLVLIADDKEHYRLMMQIVNYKIFGYGQ